MTLPAPTYDLVLLIDMQIEADARAKIVADTRAFIEAQGELLRYDEWGERPLTYPIEKRTSAEYHLFQFHVGAVELLSGLDRTLRITDGLLRFRIIKLAPGVPEAPNMGTGAAAAVAETPQPGETPVAPEAPAEPDAEELAPVASEAEAPVADVPEAEAEVAPEAPVAEPA
jgi:small subunit ribosomal protein S6